MKIIINNIKGRIPCKWVFVFFYDMLDMYLMFNFTFFPKLPKP